MKTLKSLVAFPLSAISLALLTSTVANASAVEDLSKAVKDSKVDVTLRYRLETVDESNPKEDATASTLLSRLTVNTGKFYNFKAQIGLDDVTSIGNDQYNSFENERRDYSVVADPEGTEVNLANISYHGSNYTFVAGRQRINLDDQRFVGGVAWRQNEQTYDGYRLFSTPTDKLKIDVSYIYNINKLFGEDSVDKPSDWHGSNILANASYKLDKAHKLTGFYYDLDLDQSAANSSKTIGVKYNGKFNIGEKNKFALNASYATQSDAHDNQNDYDADYIALEGMFVLPAFSVGAGYELLGSDNGASFQTPLATLHKFNGFADKFLATPADGLEDVYIKAVTNFKGVKFVATYHDFTSDEGSTDYGTEFNFVSVYKFNKHISGLVKFASYSADDLSVDTDKFWLMITTKF